jgi:TrmH family RNA methyltransferase
VLDDIQDPGNLGTIIRNADWFGVENIICSKGTADAYNPKVVQSTMASLGRVNILYTNIPEWLQQNKDIKKYAAVLGGKDLAAFGKIKEGILVIGNESKGISPEVQQLADEKITIPKIGAAESLNAAVATAVILYSINNG